MADYQLDLVAGLTHTLTFETRDADGNLQAVDGGTFTSTSVVIEGTQTSTPTPTTATTGVYRIAVEVPSNATIGADGYCAVVYNMDGVTVNRWIMAGLIRASTTVDLAYLEKVARAGVTNRG